MNNRQNVLARAIRRERVFRDRMNAFDAYDDVDFKFRYRFHKETVRSLIDELYGDLDNVYVKPTDVDPCIQVLIALRFYANGSHQRTIGDLHGVSISTANRVINRVSRKIAQRKRFYITFPQPHEFNDIKRGFAQFANIPNVIGAIDCTHIKILRPSEANPIRFKNRKPGICSFSQ